VKRFHSARFPRRLFDRWRAQRELAALRRLRTAGLPVPVPIAIQRKGRSWELVTELLEGAVPLREIIAGRAPWPATPGALARGLGRLLAALHVAGIAHGDLHAGNVMIDAAGEPWLVDLAHVGRRARGPAHSVSELVRLAADVREQVSVTFRARFLLAFLHALPDAARANLPEPKALAREVEIRARCERRRVITHARRRWTRASSAVRLHRTSGVGYLRQDIPLELPARLHAALIGVAPATSRAKDPSPHFVLPLPLHAERPMIGYVDLPWPLLRERWYESARLAMHEIGAARPVFLARTPRAFAVFELPAGTRSLAQILDRDGPAPVRRLARALGTLVGHLHDRGLTVRGLVPGNVWIAPDGECSLGIGLALFALAPSRRIASVNEAAALLGDPSRVARAAFCAAYVAAHRGGRAERAALREELLRG